MIITRDDVVCVLPMDVLQPNDDPRDYLSQKVSALNPWISSYDYDADRKTIRMSVYFDKDGANILPLHKNLIGDCSELLIIDSIHGVFKGCQIEWMEYICNEPISPYIVCEITPMTLSPWGDELPMSCYNTSSEHYGIHEDGKNGKPLSSLHHSLVKTEGISIFNDDSGDAKMSLGDKTSSINVMVRSNGEISAKQIITLEGNLREDQDPSDPKILNSIKEKVGLGNKRGAVSEHLRWMFYDWSFSSDEKENDEEPDEEENAHINFHWGKYISIEMQETRMRAVTYVQESLDFNRGPRDPDVTLHSYCLYYDGSIVSK